jgi:3D (Asp-Asp-Asp) domain-containing protein
MRAARIQAIKARTDPPPPPKPPDPPPQTRSVTVNVGGYQQVWLVTWYSDCCQMADGNYVHPGAAACGYDVPLGTRVYVPGYGTVVCEDRIGYDPWHHVDIWDPSGSAHGLGSDSRTVTIYPP